MECPYRAAGLWWSAQRGTGCVEGAGCAEGAGCVEGAGPINPPISYKIPDPGGAAPPRSYIMPDLGGSEIKAGRDFDSYSCQNPALPLLFLKKHCFIFPLLQAK